jgi:hypothetical protein
VKRDG